MPMMRCIPKQFEASGSHREVGFAIGQRFAEQIHRSLDAAVSSHDGHGRFLQERVLPHHRTPEGQARYQQLLELHTLDERRRGVRYPDYFAELEGIAQGSRRPFEDLFLS